MSPWFDCARSTSSGDGRDHSSEDSAIDDDDDDNDILLCFHTSSFSKGNASLLKHLSATRQFKGFNMRDRHERH